MSYGNYPDLTGVKKILLIKMRHHGDVLLTTPLFSFLKSKMPQSAIDALVYSETAPMLEGHPAIRTVHLYDKAWKKSGRLSRLRQELRLLNRVRREKYDLVMNLTEGDRGAIIALASKAPIRVGLDPKKSGFLGKASVFTHLVKLCPTPRHTVEKHLDCARRIGLFPEIDERELFFHIPESAQAVCPKKPYLVIHPVSRWRFKCWPVANVANLMRLLHSKGYKLVLTASPDRDELAMVQEIINICPEVPIVNLAGKTSLKELGALIQGAEALICVDSVPLHLASALKKPVVALFGPTSELNWGPWQNPRARVVVETLSCRPCGMDGCGGSKRSDCLALIPEARVLHALGEILEEFI